MSSGNLCSALREDLFQAIHLRVSNQSSLVSSSPNFLSEFSNTLESSGEVPDEYQPSDVSVTDTPLWDWGDNASSIASQEGFLLLPNQVPEEFQELMSLVDFLCGDQSNWTLLLHQLHPLTDPLLGVSSNICDF